MRCFIVSTLLAAASGQNYGHQTKEFHPPLPTSTCSKGSAYPNCDKLNTTVSIDSNWRWTHHVDDYKNCYTGNLWDETYCPNVDECTQNCAIDGVDNSTWHETYGVNWKDNAINLTFVSKGKYSTNVGGRTYLMENQTHYQMFKLLGKEFTFDVEVKNLPCGLNGALYFVEMDADGGKAKYPDNKAGAELGTGYCDAQCPHDLKWINGQANVGNWTPSKTDKNAGTGHFGTCCAELDIWEANMISTQMTVHSCSSTGQTRCEGVDCGDNDKGDRFKGLCDKDGCDFNPYRVGDTSFYGPGPAFKIDSTKKITVVTQFVTNDAGELIEMKRKYVQNGKVIENTDSTSYGKYGSITDEQCVAQKKEFTDIDYFSKLGGLKSMGEAMGRGMTLVMSMWDDHDVDMIWLDAIDPYPIPPGKKGAPRGTCNQTSGDPEFVEKVHPGANVVFSDIRWGDFDTTYAASNMVEGKN